MEPEFQKMPFVSFCFNKRASLMWIEKIFFNKVMILPSHHDSTSDCKWGFDQQKPVKMRNFTTKSGEFTSPGFRMTATSPAPERYLEHAKKTSEYLHKVFAGPGRPDLGGTLRNHDLASYGRCCSKVFVSSQLLLDTLLDYHWKQTLDDITLDYMILYHITY